MLNDGHLPLSDPGNNHVDLDHLHIVRVRRRSLRSDVPSRAIAPRSRLRRQRLRRFRESAVGVHRVLGHPGDTGGTPVVRHPGGYCRRHAAESVPISQRQDQTRILLHRRNHNGTHARF